MTSTNWSQEDLDLITRVYLLVRKLPREEWSSALDRLLPGNTLHRKDVEQLLEPDLKGDSTYSLVSDEVSSDSQPVEQSEALTEDGEALRPGEILAERFEIVKPLGRGCC